jgi:hypothetical protein
VVPLVTMLAPHKVPMPPVLFDVAVMRHATTLAWTHPIRSRIIVITPAIFWVVIEVRVTPEFTMAAVVAPMPEVPMVMLVPAMLAVV